MAFFAGNPFSTPVGQKIEQATSELLSTEDWGLNLEICDFINSSEEFAKDAVKAIKKRLSQTPKNYKVVMYTLIVLETCVKNTGHKFHILVCSKDFVQEMVKMIGPKNDPPAAIQSKVLSLIQAWSETFKHQSDLSGVCQVYADLRHKGVEFPPPEADATPIITPNASATVQSKANVGSEREASLPPPSGPRPPPIGGASPRHPHPHPPALNTPQQGITSEIRSKLEKELGVVESNATVLSEMLSELLPGHEHVEDLNLLEELYATCQTMQKRVVELVARVSDDILTGDLLRVNDVLNNLFIRYDRYMSKSRVKGSPVKSPDNGPPSHRQVCSQEGAVGGAGILPPLPTEEVSLIDLNDDTPSPPSGGVSDNVITHQIVSGVDLLVSTPKPEDVDDFDSFAQSRTIPVDSSSKKVPDGDAPDSLPVETEQVESNFDSMERWMSSQPYGAEISSDAFQKFLSDRATAAEKLPPVGDKDEVDKEGKEGET